MRLWTRCCCANLEQRDTQRERGVGLRTTETAPDGRLGCETRRDSFPRVTRPPQLGEKSDCTDEARQRLGFGGGSAGEDLRTI